MESWELETASLTDNYQALEVSIVDPDGEFSGTQMPVLPVSHSEDQIVIMIPHVYATWLPPVLVPLADGDGTISPDGNMVTGAFLILSPLAVE